MHPDVPKNEEVLGENLSIAEMRKRCWVDIPVQTAINRLKNAGVYKESAHSKIYQTSELTRARLRKILLTVRPPETDSIEKLWLDGYHAILDKQSLEGRDSRVDMALVRNRGGNVIKKS